MAAATDSSSLPRQRREAGTRGWEHPLEHPGCWRPTGPGPRTVEKMTGWCYIYPCIPPLGGASVTVSAEALHLLRAPVSQAPGAARLGP
jgi:hypothetical protein